MKIHFGNPPYPDSVCSALGHYSASEFQSATRSTIPLLSLLKHGQDDFRKITDVFGLSDPIEASLEYAVQPTAGRGVPSKTDLIVSSDEAILAIEAKWTEGLGETVEAWFSQGAKPANRELVFGSWLKMLGCEANYPETRELFAGEIYQMVHRCASAVCVANKQSKRANVAYLLFRSNHGTTQTASTDEVCDKLKHLRKLTHSGDNFVCKVIAVNLEPTESYQQVLEMRKGRESTADAVVEQLCGSSPPFRFSLMEPIEIE